MLAWPAGQSPASSYPLCSWPQIIWLLPTLSASGEFPLFSQIKVCKISFPFGSAGTWLELKKKTEGKERKCESIQMDKFTNPRFFFKFLISPMSIFSLVILAQLEGTQLQFILLASTLSGLMRWRLDSAPQIPGTLLLWSKSSLVES